MGSWGLCKLENMFVSILVWSILERGRSGVIRLISWGVWVRGVLYGLSGSIGLILAMCGRGGLLYQILFSAMESAMGFVVFSGVWTDNSMAFLDNIRQIFQTFDTPPNVQ